MPTLEHEVTIASTPSSVFQALTTQEGLRSWHTAEVSGDGPLGGEWHLGKSGKDAFVWEVTQATPNNVVAWKCTSGPGTSAGTQVHYVIDVQPDGRTKVILIHSGWESEDGNYKKCNTLWGGLLVHLQRYLETGVPAPMFA